ncbi:bifunctional nuclease domain-containing protein [Candidatus Flexifilum breve]|uniref:bifunctional nuclease domain-containing protein n=1 Tax=Candidatus Flexifilum breve TaxID=3140694 RepID=UPI0031CCB786
MPASSSMWQGDNEVDARPSDAIALAVRAKVPVFVSDHVMERHSIEPEEDVERTIARQRTR